MPRDQLVLIPTALEDMIPEGHPARLVDEILDMLDWSEWESSYHGAFGQPPIHPLVMAKILLLGMIRRIRSSRSLEYELKHSIDFMWLTSGRRVDHTTISEFRRKNSKALRGIFQQMVKLAINLDIANLSELCIDGTRVLASANRFKTWTAKRLASALEKLDAQIAEALEAFEVNDALDDDLLGQDISADSLPDGVSDLKTRRERLKSLMETAKSMDETRRKNGSKGEAQIPKNDTDSRILLNKEGGYAANFTPMATVESQSGLIVMADVLIGNVEHDQFSTIVDTVQSDYDVTIERVTADSAYTTGENLTTAEEKEVELIGPLAETKCDNNPAVRDDPTQPVAAEDLDRLPINPQTKRFDKTAFVYDEEADVYYCPASQPLPHRTTENKTYRGGKRVKRQVYTCHHCAGCSLADRCRKNPDAKRGREVMHDEHEGARRRQRERMKTDEAKEAYSRRLHTGELPFAVIKARFAMRRFLLRGIEGVTQEWRWASTAFNLSKLMSRWGELRAQLPTSTATR
jgi:transposase